eukprot:3648616-Pyramimonas_sp.AAC.1
MKLERRSMREVGAPLSVWTSGGLLIPSGPHCDGRLLSRALGVAAGWDRRCHDGRAPNGLPQNGASERASEKEEEEEDDEEEDMRSCNDPA